MNPTVVALLVSHDGSRWLTAVVEGLRSQTVPLAGVVCVDTGSHDDSPDLLLDAFDEVVTVSGRTAYPEAVRIGLEQIPAEAAEWVWLLHDDSNPAPDALERLLAASAADPEADVLGPKLREWPSLKRLLEVGITISGTGRRETGLEAGEYDQGQHDEVRQVLAVNTAGMLVRRAVYERLGGLDDNLPMFGNDLDFGWRAATAGVRTVVVPDAVVFHAEAAHRGLRRTPLTGRHTHYHERRAALFTLLANAPARALPWQVVRLFFGTLLRMVGFLVVRSAGEALDDLAALFSVYAGPGEIRRARQARKAIGDHDPKPLLAPWWVPYRHGLDFVGDIAAAATNQAQDVADRRRAAKEAAAPAPLGDVLGLVGRGRREVTEEVEAVPVGHPPRREQRCRAGGVDVRALPAGPTCGADLPGMGVEGEQRGQVVERLAQRADQQEADHAQHGAEREPDDQPGQAAPGRVGEQREQRRPALLVVGVPAGERRTPDAAVGRLGVENDGVGDDDRTVTGGRRTPPEVEVVAEDRELRVEPAERLEDRAAHQHAGGVDREHLAHLVVLTLVVLAALEAGLAPAGAADGDAELEQPLQRGPLAQLGTQDVGRRVGRGRVEQRAQRARSGVGVVVDQPDPLRRLAPLAEPVETSGDCVRVRGGSGEREHLAVRLLEQRDTAVLAAGVDRHDGPDGGLLGPQAVDDGGQPAVPVMADEQDRDR